MNDQINAQSKNLLAVTGSIALLAAAVSSVWFVYTYTQSIDTSMRSFSVVGEGKVIAVPDVAEFQATVLTEGGLDVAELQKTNAEKSNAIIEFLKGKEIEDKDVQSSGYSINPRYTYKPCSPKGVCPEPEITGYSVSHTISVKVRDFAKAGEILKGVVGAGANTVSGLSFTIDDRAALEQEARTKAIADAAQKAQAVANAAGFRLGRLLSIEESLSPWPMPYYDFGRGGGGDVATEAKIAPNIEPGSQEVTIQVTARVEIK